MSWQVIDTFNRANSAAGGVGTTSQGGPAWDDTSGVWKILSNQAAPTTAATSITDKFLLRPAAENFQNGKFRVLCAGNGQPAGVVARATGAGRVVCYHANGGAGTLTINGTGVSGTTTGNVGTYTGSAWLEFELVGTTLYGRLFASDGVTQIGATVTCSTTHNVSGQYGLFQWQGNTFDQIELQVGAQGGFSGTSITVGNGASVQANRFSSKTIARLASLGLSAVEFNAGVSGSKSADWLPGGANLAAAISAFQGCDFVVHEIGANDATNGVSGATYGANTAATIEAYFAGISTLKRLYLVPPITPSSYAGNTYVAYAATRDTYLTQLAAIENGGNQRYMAGAAALVAAFNTSLPTYSGDSLHPNDAGHLLIGNALGDAIYADLTANVLPGSIVAPVVADTSAYVQNYRETTANRTGGRAVTIDYGTPTYTWYARVGGSWSSVTGPNASYGPITAIPAGADRLRRRATYSASTADAEAAITLVSAGGGGGGGNPFSGGFE